MPARTAGLALLQSCLLSVAAWSQSGGVRARAECPDSHAAGRGSRVGISSGGTDVAVHGIAGLAPHAPAPCDMTNRILISQCFCGDRSPGIYSESHLRTANNVHLGVFRA